MKYTIHVTSKDIFGHDVVDKLLELGGIGAKVQEGTLPNLKWPYQVKLEVEADEPPMPSAQVRVFDAKNKEVFATVLQDQAKQKEKAQAKAEKKEVANFSVEQEEPKEEEVEDNSALATNDDGEAWTKEQLDDLDWDTLKRVVSNVGLKGRDRQKLTKNYLEAVAKQAESQES